MKLWINTSRFIKNKDILPLKETLLFYLKLKRNELPKIKSIKLSVVYSYMHNIFNNLKNTAIYFIIAILLFSFLCLFQAIFYSENQLIRGTYFDILNVYRIDAIALLIVAVALTVFFQSRGFLSIKSNIFLYLIFIFLIRGISIIILPNLWYIEEYWRIGRSYEAAVKNYLTMSGLNEENPFPFIFMSLFIKLTHLNPFIVVKIYDLIEIILIPVILFVTVYVLYNVKDMVYPALFFGIIYIQLGHFSRQDYAFLIYIMVIYLFFKLMKDVKLNIKDILLSSFFYTAVILSHPAYPLILVINIITIGLTLKLYSLYLQRNLNNASLLQNRSNNGISSLIMHSILFLTLIWAMWHIVVGANNFNVVRILYESFNGMITLLSTYGLSTNAIIVSRQIERVNPGYSFILLLKQVFIMLSLAISVVAFSYILYNMIRKKKTNNYISLGVLGFYLSNVVTLLLVAFSGHVPLRGTIMFSLSIIFLLPLLLIYKYKLFKIFYYVLFIILAMGLLLSPLLAYSSIPIVYSDTSEISLIDYSISLKDNLTVPYVIEYNGPIRGYFLGRGELPVYMPPSGKYLERISNGDYELLLITHRIRYRDNFFIYIMNICGMQISSYSRLYNLLFKLAEREGDLIYFDTMDNYILYTKFLCKKT